MLILNNLYHVHNCLKKVGMMVLLMSMHTAWGQLQITYPTSRMVVQRNNANQSVVYVAGNYSQYIDSLSARFVARPFAPTQGTTTAWNTIQRNPTGGVFYGMMVITGGWYNLELRGYFDGQIVASTSVERIGIGEVFVVAGQSNASGDNELASAGNYGTGATDDRVSAIHYNRNPSENYYDSVLPILPFSHLDYNSLLSPFGVGGWSWGALGDTLVKKLNVPVAFFNAGWSGSKMQAWYESANNANATPTALFGFYNHPAGMPYGNLRLALNNYAAQFGIRAVLWHQGESDNWEETSRSNYGVWLKSVIEKSRLHSAKPNLAWVVATASRTKGLTLDYSRIWQPVIEAQKDVIGINVGSPNFTPNVIAGPSTDELVGNNWRTMPDSLHFVGQGHRVHASAWASVLNNNFFSTVTPYLPEPLPRVAVECATNTQLQLNSVNTYPAYFWTINPQGTNVTSTNNNVTLGAGNYILRVRTSNENMLYAPTVTVPASFSGIIPISSTASGNWFDTNTWVCGRIPTALDIVTVEPSHTVTLPSNNQGFFRKIYMKGSFVLQIQAVLSR